MIFATLSPDTDNILDVKVPSGRLSLVLLQDGTVVVRALYHGDGTGQVPTMLASLPEGFEWDRGAAIFRPNPSEESDIMPCGCSSGSCYCDGPPSL